MAWFVSRRNCPSFLTANTVAGPLDGAHRSGPAGGDHQDPATTLLLPRRTARPLGAPPHFASSPALALAEPVQWRPRSIASPALSRPDGGNQPADPPSGQLNVPTNSRQPSPRGTLPAYRLSNSARHGRTAAIIVPVWLPSRRPHPHLLESGLPRSPSLTHHPLCQRHGRLASVDSGLGVR